MKLLATCAIVTATTTLAQAQTVTVFQTGFEPIEGYAPGNLNGQNGWFAYLGEDLNFGEIVNTNPLAGSQSALLDCQDVQPDVSGFYYAAVGRLFSIPPTLGSVPLRYIEVTAKCAILDPTIDPTHRGGSWLFQYSGNDNVGGVGVASRFGQYVYGWPSSKDPNLTLPVTPSVTFEARNLLDYQTGTGNAWMNGQPAFERLDMGLQTTLISSEIYLEGVTPQGLPFDTRVWFDDLVIRAVYGCQGDTNNDLTVNIDDLLGVIGAWGTCKAPPCVEDVTGDGVINIDDLLAVIGGWGSC